MGSSPETKLLVIVGAGASGMLAAVSARQAARGLGIADAGLRIVLLERNTRPGAKIAISGGGHCNVTHDGPVDRLLEKGFLRKNELRFVRPSVYAFTNSDLLALLARYGVPTEAREDGRVFPVSGAARDVLDAIRRMLRDASAEVATGCRVDALEASGDGFVLRAGAERIEADAVILAAGGSAWGSSGTTGDGVRLAASVGHSVVTVLPALAPVFFKEPPDPGLVGVTLRGVGLVAGSGKQSDMRRGDLLISHRGISGPACLSLSRPVAAMMAGGGEAPALFADFFPGHDEPAVSAFVLDHSSRNGAQLVRTFLQRCPIAPERLFPATRKEDAVGATIPNAFVPWILRRAGIGEGQMLSMLTRQQRTGLVSVLKRFELGRARKVPLDRAEVSAGGVSLSEIDPRTMASRLHRRLFCCGELLDYAGEVGGFNLQAAFSTGWAAGSNAALSLCGSRSAGA
ncbi:MAG: aminoacetone oxidase family FAD-binding enzyme [Chlorobiaceae bacterium]|nr:aminoacetone oxidase family FAD-binding enzyme [Chlorobiaceae bacterium]